MDAVLAMSPPLPARAGGVRPRPSSTAVRWSSTCRTCSRTSPSSSGKLTDPRLVAGRPLAGAHDLRPRRGGHRAVRGPPGQHRGQGPPRPPGRRSRHPQLRRHRAHPARCPGPPPCRRQLGIGDDQIVVLYAGNVGFSQSLDLLVEAARRLAHRPELVFVVNGGGSGLARAARKSTEDLRNVRFSPVPTQGAAGRGSGQWRPPRRAPPDGPGRVERAVQDLLDPGRRPAVAGLDRPGDGGRQGRGRGRLRRAVPPGRRRRLHRGRGDSLARPRRAGRHGRAGPGMGGAVGLARPPWPRPTSELFDEVGRDRQAPDAPGERAPPAR